MKPIKRKKSAKRRKRKSVPISIQDTVQALVGEMYDKLAAKMVIALYREKEQILKQLGHETTT